MRCDTGIATPWERVHDIPVSIIHDTPKQDRDYVQIADISREEHTSENSSIVLTRHSTRGAHPTVTHSNMGSEKKKKKPNRRRHACLQSSTTDIHDAYGWA